MGLGYDLVARSSNFGLDFSRILPWSCVLLAHSCLEGLNVGYFDGFLAQELEKEKLLLQAFIKISLIEELSDGYGID